MSKWKIDTFMESILHVGDREEIKETRKCSEKTDNRVEHYPMLEDTAKCLHMVQVTALNICMHENNTSNHECSISLPESEKEQMRKNWTGV